MDAFAVFIGHIEVEILSDKVQEVWALFLLVSDYSE